MKITILFTPLEYYNSSDISIRTILPSIFVHAYVQRHAGHTSRQKFLVLAVARPRRLTLRFVRETRAEGRDRLLTRCHRLVVSVTRPFISGTEARNSDIIPVGQR